MDLVSVITPAFNSSKFIADTIESVISQTYSNWEMIIVNDCSSDNTCAIVEAYSKKHSNVKLISLQNKSGPGQSRNTGIAAAKGRYIAFIDSDDLWVKNKLERQLTFMESVNSPFSYTSYLKIDEQGRPIGNAFHVPDTIDYFGLLHTCVIGCLTAIYDTKYFGKVYMPDLPKTQDYALWLNLLKKVDHASGLNECLSKYRIRHNSISRNKLKKAYYQWKVYREIEKIPLLKSFYFLSNYFIHGIMKSR